MQVTWLMVKDMHLYVTDMMDKVYTTSIGAGMVLIAVQMTGLH